MSFVTNGLKHESVMTTELVAMFDLKRGGHFLDCTVGTGGHSKALLKAGANRILGLDRDEEVLPLAARTLEHWKDHVDLIHSDFRNFQTVMDQRQLLTVDGALADLGMSSVQLDAEGRGFTFRRDEPLDMRMDRSVGKTAAEIIQVASEKTLADLIFEYGEERYARRIARAIVVNRVREPLVSTGQLATLVRKVVPRRKGQRIDAATRTFQALRIWVNQELSGLDVFIREIFQKLRVGARLVVITFHSLEDRIIKHTFRDLAKSGDVPLRILTKRPIRPSSNEVSQNPRARSAKLRAAEKVA
tara:strand:+ start:4156 stop:5061 length:906 start_codon:yes stop_codon:yes gene_type:complete